MKSFIAAITRLSMRFRAVTLAGVAIVSALGILAITQLQQELIPPIEFPQTIILAQANGMSSEQVLNVLTTRLEDELDTIDDIVNIESNTTGAFGTVIIARNDFGLNQERLRAEIEDAVERVWLPTRRIAPEARADGDEFAAALLADMTPDVLIHLAQADPNFVFQLSPEAWASFSDDTVSTLLAYLAAQTEETATSSALRRLVDQELLPQLAELEDIASVSVSGGQVIPGDGEEAAFETAAQTTETVALVLELSPEVWDVVAGKAGLGAQNTAAVEALADIAFETPTGIPALPPSWQLDRFEDASDLLELQALTRTTADIFDDLREDGQIVGPLGKTDDLTPEIVTRMLEIEPSLVAAFQGEHLVALSPEVFASLPDDFIATLDGFTRDELAAVTLAESITGESSEIAAVELPNVWRIQPPRIITFSFADFPLAQISVFGSGDAETVASAEQPVENPTEGNETEAPVNEESAANIEIPEGPELPVALRLLGTPFGLELDTADDLINIQLSGEAAEQLGAETLQAADLFNFIVLLADPSMLPEGFEPPPFPIDAAAIIGSVSAETVAFIAENDPAFIANLSATVYDNFSDEVLTLDAISPPLGDTWNTLANQSQFANQPLRTADDLLIVGGGQASGILNAINATVPEEFAGYEVRLFDSLSPASVRYFALNEADFFQSIEFDVVRKFSAASLAVIPKEILDALDLETASTLQAIIDGEQPSAASNLAALYSSEIAPADPNAPALNPQWQSIGDFNNIELDTADDFFRFPENFRFETPADLMNNLFTSAQGINFANALFGQMPADAIDYMLARDATVFDNLRPDAIVLLPQVVAERLPVAVRERGETGSAVVFKPTDQITRTNGAPSLIVTIFKTAEANTVQAFHDAEDILLEIDEANDDINVFIAFEQASFVEESISGVAREGSLGAVFAIVIILLFLSGGHWSRSPRRLVGAVILAAFIALLAIVTATQLGSADNDLNAAFSQVDVTLRILFILGALSGFLVLIWPSDLPYPAWRSTLVIAVSIPLSILFAFVGMRWFSPAVNDLLAPLAESSGFVTFILRLFPESITINIMTLSGLTVAIGRVVDDSIVVLENSFRQIQDGGDKQESILAATRDVSVAIFSATIVTMVIFLPLGLTGGIIGAFFIPFGLAVTYALAGSYIVAITVVPVLANLFIHEDEAGNEPEGRLAQAYLPILGWALRSRTNRIIVVLAAVGSMIFGFFLFGSRPAAFFPNFGEPQITIAIDMPPGTRILETNERVSRLEQFVHENIAEENLTNIRTQVGGSASTFEDFIIGGSTISENRAQIEIGMATQEVVDFWIEPIRDESEAIFGEGTVRASGAGNTGFGGFALVLSGPAEDILAVDTQVIEALNEIDGLTNVSSNISDAAAATTEGEETIIRIDRQSAAQYTGELETSDTLGVTQIAKQAVQDIPGLPDTLTVDEGFDTRQQTEGFQNMFIAMGIALIIVVLVLIITFRSIIHWLTIIFSIIVAPVGAAIALTVADRVLGISAMIGLLMLIGIVVTNAVVLLDRVQTNMRERKMSVHDALIEAGGRRLRPILMTALTAIIALIPLAIGLSEGAIIAAELGTVVIGGLISSTFLTLIVVPVAYSFLQPVHGWLAGLVNGSEDAVAAGD